MDYTFLNRKFIIVIIVLSSLPILVIFLMAFIYTNGVTTTFSLAGFREILTSLRLEELLKISERAIVVSILSTVLSFTISYLVITYTSSLFQSIFYILITLPFLINESMRVFSWQYVLSENGVLNNFLSFMTMQKITLFNSSNSGNIYLVMIITCIPFGIFICSASLKTIPQIYWNVINDLNFNPFYRVIRVVIPLSKFALIASLIVVFFISFSLSAEVNFLGGATKISTRNLVLSLMSASKFQAIFSLGALILFVLFVTLLLYKLLFRYKVELE